MSWDVSLKGEDGATLLAPEGHEEGGTYVVGGHNYCDLNVTYNYGLMMAMTSVHPQKHLHGETAADTEKRLFEAIVTLQKHSHNHNCQDYWHPCPENVLRTVTLLWSWAEYHTKRGNGAATWDVM